MKNNLLKGLTIFTILAFPAFSPAQNVKQAGTFMVPIGLPQLDDMIEKTAGALEADEDYSSLTEDFIELAEKPVDLNEAGEDDLNKVPFLSPVQRTRLLEYVAAYGEVLSVYELQSVPGFDSALVRKISPFILIKPSSKTPAPTPGNLLRLGRHTLLLHYAQAFPTSAGYMAPDSANGAVTDSYYPGGPQRYYFRYTYNWLDKIRIGLAGEKDPGEQFFMGAQSRGLDFYAAYLGLSNIGILKNLTIGNFRVSYGQGLTIGSGATIGSVPGFSANIMQATGIRPGLGMSEGSYLRGLAATIRAGRLEFGGFASYHPRDATISRIDNASQLTEEISSFSETGYHRTKLELAKKNALTELACGGTISISMAPSQQFGFKTGVTALYYRYSAAVFPKIYPYSRYAFHGNQNLNAGLDVQIRYHGIYFFGEISRSVNRGMAWLAGTTLTPDPAVCITLIYRNYQAMFQNLFSNAFGQNSLNANERGIYAAINAAVHPKLSLSGYVDLFTFPWLKYRVDAPTRGQEFGLMLGWQPSGSVKVLISGYQKNMRSNESASTDQIIHKLCSSLARSYRTDLEWLPLNGILLKTRLEVKETGESSMKRPLGYLVYQEARVNAVKWLEEVTLRYALFDTPGYASRIYVYEPEVLYGYSVPAYQGKGMRTCIVLKFRISGKVDFWLRGGITYYTDRKEVGTGHDMTEGNVREELTCQLLIRL